MSELLRQEVRWLCRFSFQQNLVCIRSISKNEVFPGLLVLTQFVFKVILFLQPVKKIISSDNGGCPYIFETDPIGFGFNNGFAGSFGTDA